MKRLLQILPAALLSFALLLVQMPREAVHEMLHEHAHAECGEDQHVVVNYTSGEQIEETCELFKQLQLAFPGLIASPIELPQTALAVQPYFPLATQATLSSDASAKARGPPKSC